MIGLISTLALGVAFGDAIRSRRYISAGCFGVALVVNALAAFAYYA
jgi:hypothetical protein